MTNGEKYKTEKERAAAFRRFCQPSACLYCMNCKVYGDGKGTVIDCVFAWLELEAEYMEKVLECPFCGSECRCETFGDVNKVECQNGCACHCQSGGMMSREEAISRHNRVVRSVQHEKMARDVLNATCDRHARGMTCEECVNVNCPSCPIVEQKGQQA